jgi:hypothetical protein
MDDRIRVLAQIINERALPWNERLVEAQKLRQLGEYEQGQIARTGRIVALSAQIMEVCDDDFREYEKLVERPRARFAEIVSGFADGARNSFGD